jgi:putative lipoprotein (rSAM/lipoprotein system)
MRGIIGGLSFTSALFIFQACYGTPQDLGSDLMVHGKVTSSVSGAPIEGIKVSVASNSQYAHTDEEGLFSFYTVAADNLNIRFEDIDAEENGSYADRDTMLTEAWEEVYLDIKMEKK